MGEERAATASSQWERKSDSSERLRAERGEGKEPAGHLPQRRGGEGADPVADPDVREEKGSAIASLLVAGKGTERRRVSQGEKGREHRRGKGRQRARRSNGRRVGAAARATEGGAAHAEGGEE